MMVSVIVPNYNHAPYLKQRIDSILNQTYTDLELIILDDCSTDNSREVIESYRNNPKVTKIVYNEVNGGTPFKQWDKGIELAQGEWIWIAESDDWAEPDFLKTLFREIEYQKDCGFAYTGTNWVDKKGEVLWNTKCSDETKYYNGIDFIKDNLLIYNSIANVSECIFKKSLYHSENVKLYENMKLCGDWFFYVLLAEQTNVLEIQKKLSNYRLHDANISSFAELNGLTFIEGIYILDYVVDKFNISDRVYASRCARFWLLYKKKYHYSNELNRKIRLLFKKNHRRIVWNYDLLSLKQWIKNRVICRK